MIAKRISIHKIRQYAEREYPPNPDEYNSDWYKDCLIISMARDLLEVYDALDSRFKTIDLEGATGLVVERSLLPYILKHNFPEKYKGIPIFSVADTDDIEVKK